MLASKKRGQSKSGNSGVSGSGSGKQGDFETKLKRLEELSGAMKNGELPLEEAMKNFEEGVRLARSLEKELERIERRVEILVNNPQAEDEKPELELFPGLDGE
jgi:exodeoxyribonuclease VII small subunit